MPSRPLHSSHFHGPCWVNAERHVAIIRWREGLQRKWDFVPLDLQGLSLRQGFDRAAEVRGWALCPWGQPGQLHSIHESWTSRRRREPGRLLGYLCRGPGSGQQVQVDGAGGRDRPHQGHRLLDIRGMALGPSGGEWSSEQHPWRGHPGLREQADGLQMGLGLNERSLQVRHTNQGEGVHAVNEDCDRARMGRRFAGSTSWLTPQIFAETMANIVYNSSTATIEEVERRPRSRQLIRRRCLRARQHPCQSHTEFCAGSIEASNAARLLRSPPRSRSSSLLWRSLPCWWIFCRLDSRSTIDLLTVGCIFTLQDASGFWPDHDLDLGESRRSPPWTHCKRRVGDRVLIMSRRSAVRTPSVWSFTGWSYPWDVSSREREEQQAVLIMPMFFPLLCAFPPCFLSPHSIDYLIHCLFM